MLSTKKVLLENNTNFRTPSIKLKHPLSPDFIKESPSTFNNNQSLPRITERTRNTTKYFEDEEEEEEEYEEEESESERLPIMEITNQSNIARINSEEESEDIHEEKTNENSKILIRDKSNNQIYLLEFKAVDVELIPVYLRYRTFEENQNDKCNQPKCRISYENVFNNKSRRFMQLHKSYKIDTSKNEGKVSIMSFKKALFKKRLTCPPEPKPKRSISDPVSTIKQSVINMKYKNIEYKVKPGLMTLASSVIIDNKADQEREKVLRSLNMDLPINHKNKASVICNNKGDILKFNFTLSEITCNKVKISTSIGVLAKDDNVYVKEFSDISFRTIYIAVPKTNYEYQDPMIKTRHRNRTMKFNHTDPIWLDEQRKKRLKEYTQCRKKNPYDNIAELKNGSNIFYESFNSLYKLNGGTYHCEVADDEYEKWVESIQKSELPPKIESYQEQIDSEFASDVPDWDLILNSK